MKEVIELLEDRLKDKRHSLSIYKEGLESKNSFKIRMSQRQLPQCEESIQQYELALKILNSESWK